MSNKEKLINIWKLNSSFKEHISKKDINCFKNNDYLKLSYFYRTHIMPLPFMGEVDDPDILILALNPSYDPINDEEDTENVEKDKYINNLFDVNFFSNIEKSKKIIGEHTFNWWNNRVFNNVKLINKEKIGIYNLCGYHSKEYKKIPKIYLESNSYLPTQNEQKTIIEKLVKNGNIKLIIVVWGKSEWEKYLGIQLNKENVVVLNDYNNLNCSIYSY